MDLASRVSPAGESRPDAANGAAPTRPEDLHTFLERWEREHPEEIAHVEKPIDARFEVRALITKLERQQKFPIVICHHVVSNGRRLDYPLVTFLMSSRQRLAELLELPIDLLVREVYQRRNDRQPLVVVDRAAAPVKQVVRTGADVDVTAFPAPHHHDMDPGPYVTAGFLTLYNPETGLDNSALHRGWLKGPDEIRVYMTASTDNNRIWLENERRDEDTRVAYWIGHHPLAVLGCQSRVPVTESHYAAAGGLLRQPLRLVPSETLGDDFLVPADAEVVIEGIIPAHERRPEGPFGEYPRYSGPQRWNPYVRVTAVTHRRDAYWHDLMVGHSHWVGSLNHEGHVYETVKRVVPTLRQVYVPMSGTGHFHVYMRIEKNYDGLGKSALVAALGADPRIKHAWVFDEDVDIMDEQEVLRAMATRFQGDRDMIVISQAVGPILDPSAAGITGAKVGFDCTRPAPPTPFSHRLSVPADVLARIDPEEYIGRAKLAAIPHEPWG
jgi:2,5-furandicarboxylate decarboxylase 1